MDHSQLSDQELERRYREARDPRERTALRRELAVRMQQAYTKAVEQPPSLHHKAASSQHVKDSTVPRLDTYWRSSQHNSTNTQTTARERALCTACHGSGYTHVLFWTRKCGACGGSGYRSDQVKQMVTTMVFIILVACFALAISYLALRYHLL